MKTTREFSSIAIALIAMMSSWARQIGLTQTAQCLPRSKNTGIYVNCWLPAFTLISMFLLSLTEAQGSDLLLIGTRKYDRTEIKANTGGFEANQRANIAVLQNGRFVIAWHEGSQTDCYGRTYDQQGSNASGVFILHPYGSSGWQYGPSPAPLPGGGLVAAWGGSSSYVHAQRFDASLNTMGGEIAVANINAWPAVASHTNGEFVVAFGTTDSAVYARRYDTNANPGSQFQVGPYVSGWYHPSIAYGLDGRFTIAWPSGGNIWARSYRSNESSPFGPEFRVNTTNNWSCYSPSVQYNSSNQLFIAWSGAGTADSQGIYLRAYAADTTPTGAELLVNENTAPSQSTPNLGIGRNNEMIISWRDSSDVVARLLGADTSPISHEFRVNKFTSGTQINADNGGLHGCTILDNANIAVAWSEDGASGGGVYLTMFRFLLDAAINITGQPTNQDTLIGNNVSFCVAANSQEAISYQWQFNAANIPGATNACFTITNAQMTNAGGYRCVITNSVVTSISQEAILRVLQYPRSARELYAMGYTNNGTYTIDPDGPGGQAPISIYCLMSLSGGGWTKLTSTIANSVLNSDTNIFREYLYVKNNTTLWYRSPVNKLVWNWSTGKDLYGTYYYSSGGGEGSFNVTASGEHQLYGVGGSSGPYYSAKCLIYYLDYYDPANAQTEICQDYPGIFGGACQGPVTVYIRERPGTNLWPLLLTANPTSGGTINGSGNYPDGFRVAISATPAAGYRFAYWTGDGIENTNSASTTILMTQPRTATAQFIKVWHLTVNAEPPGSGTVTGSGDYDNGTYATIMAEPGWVNWFLGWSGTGIADTNANVTNVFMDRDQVVTALFSAPDFEVTRVSAPSNAIAGQLVRIGWTITNSGTASAIGDWADRIWLSPSNQIGGNPISTNPVSSAILLEGSITREQNILIPPNRVGTYWVIAEANSDHGIGEITHSNNFAISDHPIVISATPYPNLQVAVVFAPTNAFAGQETEARWVVTNTGPRSTASAVWEDAVYLSTDTNWDTSDILLGSVSNPQSLDSGQGYLSKCTVTLPRRIQGTYYFIVKTDFRNRVNEGGLKSDNSLASNPMQLALPGWPDLQVARVTSPYEAFSGQPVTITWSVTNAGSLATDESSWHDRIYLATNQTPGMGTTPLASVPHSGILQTGQTYTVSQEVTLPVGVTGTNYYFLVQADAGNEAWEYVFENNNYGASTHATWIHLTPPPDLEVMSVSIPANICAGFDLPVAYRVANNGANDTPNYSWQDGFYLSADTNFDAYADTYLGSVSHYGQLLRTNFYDATATVRIPQNVSGNYYVIVVADSRNEVFELDKTNNHRVSAFPLNILPLADLQVASVAIPSNALSGFDITVSYRVTNIGPCATIGSSWNDGFYLSADQNLNTATDRLLGTVSHSGQLASGGGYDNTATLRLPIGLQGNYYLFVVIDSQGKVPEQNENNNASLSPIPLNLQLPDNDLQVVAIAAPSNALSGFSITLSSVVTNNGTNAIPNASWRDAFYISTNQVLDSNYVFLGEVTNYLSLPGSGSYTNSLTVRLPDGLAGDFYAFVFTDCHGEVFEQNESNNVACSEFPISVVSIPPDLVVENCNAPAGTYIAGSTIPVGWTVRNIGPGLTSVDSWSDHVVLSLDAVLGNGDDRTLSTFVHSGSLNTNESYSQSQTVTIPAPTAAGVYNIFIQTDSAGQVYESSNETNNFCLAGQITVIRPRVDLVVTSVTVTNEAYSGQNLTVAWTVQNTGISSASPSAWSDFVYLSRDPQLGTNAVLLGTLAHSGGLAPNATYTVSSQFLLPWDVQGDYYVTVRADSAGQVPESNEDNNDTSGGPVYIFLSPTPDLMVTALTVPSQALSGQPIILTWTVLNNGAATEQNWYDAVYLSFDQIFDKATDFYLGYLQHSGGLNEGSSYTATGTFNVPPNLYGPMSVFVKTDSKNQVYERQAKDNNIARSSAINVDLPPVCDLVVTAVTLPTGLVMVGETSSITYTVLNQSAATISGRWEDSVYLSSDPVWDINDTLLGKVTINRSLGPWESYTGTLNAQIPGVLPGDYYVIVRSDIRNYIPESDEGNNIGVSSQTFRIDMIELTLGVPYTNYLFTGKEDFYKINAPSNETLSVTLDSAATNGFNELFTRFAAVPNRAQYDFGYANPFAPDQQITVPDTQAGYYYNLVRGQEVPTSLAQYTIEAETVPFGIQSVTPSRIGDNGQVTLVLKGARFNAGANVVIRGAAFSASAGRVWITDSTLANARFQFTNMPNGTYDLVFTNGDGRIATLTGAVTVEPAKPFTVETAGTADMFPRWGTSFRWSGLVANRGNTDIPVLTVAVLSDSGLTVSIQNPTNALLDRSGDGTAFPVLKFNNLIPGEQRPLTFSISGYTGPFSYSVMPIAYAGAEYVGFLKDVAESARQFLLTNPVPGLPPEYAQALNDPSAWWGICQSAYLETGILSLEQLGAELANGGSIGNSRTTPRSLAGQDCKRDAYTAHHGRLISYLIVYRLCLAFNPDKLASCHAALAAAEAWSLYELTRQLCICDRQNNMQCGWEGFACGVLAGYSCPRRPIDPNEKTGHPGYGEFRFVDGQKQLPYGVYFENLADASAIAREIQVVDHLPTGLDPRSVRLQEVAFGGWRVSVPTGQSYYQTRLVVGSNLLAEVTGFVDVQSREIRWTLRAIDSATGEPPASAQIGLLPPNDATHRGEGYVTYTVQPAGGVQTGTVITNTGTIVFDNNEPIETAPVWNTIDAAPPSSSVAALPSQVPRQFLVPWFGMDDTGGSGVQGYDLYVSDNGGAYQLWLANTAANAAVYSGQPGHTYAFYSVGRDNVGNLESPPLVPDAVTTVMSNSPPVLHSISNQLAIVGGTLLITNVVDDADGASQNHIFALLQHPEGMTLDTNTGVIRWTPTCAQGSTTNPVVVSVTDDGMAPLSATNSFLVAVVECVEASLGNAVVQAGHTNSVSLRLLSTVELTNLNFSVLYDTNRFAGFWVAPDTNQVPIPYVTNGFGNFFISFDLPPDQILHGPNYVADVNFTALPGQSSTNALLEIGNVDGYKPSGGRVANAYGRPGKVIVVGPEPLLEAQYAGSNQVRVIVYAIPGSIVTVSNTYSLNAPIAWNPGFTMTSESLITTNGPFTITNQTLFLRAVR